MKTIPGNRTKKTAQTPSPQSNQANEFTDWLEQFKGKSPQQFYSDNGVAVAQSEAMAGTLHGLLGDLGIEIPEFAKLASKQFWKYFAKKSLDPQSSVEDAGVLSRLLEHFYNDSISRPQSKLEKKVMPFAKPASSDLETAARTMPTGEVAKFYIGRARAEKIMERLKNPNYLKMVKRAKPYIVIAGAWRQFEKFKSLAEAERWLRSNKIIEENFNSSEVRAIFKIIELRYRAAGRPKLSENERSIPA